MAKKLKYGLIGCGGCGVGKHLASYALYPDDVELYAVYDLDPARARDAAKKHQVPHVFSSYEEMLADPALDLVSVVTPNALHAPVSIAALKAGKHVHVEKPIAMNAAEARAILAARNAASRMVMVALNNRFTEASRFAKRFVDEGNLGEIYHARCGWRRRRGAPGMGSWFATKALSGGGPVIDLGVHFFDLTLYLMGYPEPATVSAAAYQKILPKPDPARGKPGMDVEDLAAGFVRLATGASVAFEFSWASNVQQDTTYLELLGNRAGLSLCNGELRIFTEAGGQVADLVPQVRNTSGWGQNETRHFIDCIRTGKEPLARAEEAVTMMRIIDAIYASAQSGREIDLTAAGA